MIDFLKQCLQVEEKDRLDWGQVYKHKLVRKAKKNNYVLKFLFIFEKYRNTQSPIKFQKIEFAITFKGYTVWT